ncbi:MAG TPA: PDZ domain-containing protein [Acidimicrobiia bacterium]|jgi:PDZ domain-containing protein|nr:PDZ domain-containing protein [Acidimicrobiia bacterium]
MEASHASEGSGADVIVEPLDPWIDVPAELRPPPKLPKWPFVVAGLILLIGTAIAVAWPINVPYYALSPGPVNDTGDFVVVEEPAGEESGDLFFLTVSLREINALEYVGALLNNEVDLSPRENIRPAGVSQDDLRQQNLDLMNSSKLNAKFVALTQLGYEVVFIGSGALVNSIVEDSAAIGLVQEGDLITAVDGEPIEFSEDAVALIGGRSPGEVVTLTLDRVMEDGEVETLDVEITLKPFRFIDEDGVVQEEPERGMVGVLLVNGPTEAEFPVEVDIDSQNIGGPSAGLMFTLEIMNQLTEEDLTRGYRIAGTGSIAADGTVGSIGGVRQKVFGAIDVGAAYVLVPAGNYDEALEAAGDDIEVVRIGTIDDAVVFFDSLEHAGP